jgi:hypothetical protein
MTLTDPSTPERFQESAPRKTLVWENTFRSELFHVTKL